MEINLIKCLKEPRHGNAPIDGQGGQFKAAIRYFERVQGFLFVTGLDQFINQSENDSSCHFNREKGVYRVNFTAEDIVLNDGSLAFTPDAFLDMRKHPVVWDGVTYKSGIREVHSIKLLRQEDDSQNQNYVYAIALTPCPTTCQVCYSEYSSPNAYCSEVVHRLVDIPKERFVSVKKEHISREKMTKLKVAQENV